MSEWVDPVGDIARAAAAAPRDHEKLMAVRDPVRACGGCGAGAYESCDKSCPRHPHESWWLRAYRRVVP